jgi:hypothetical protein
LELIVALAITTLVGGVLASSMYTAFRTKRAADEALAEARGAGILTELVREDLSSALPPTGIFAGAFTGLPKEQTEENSDHVSFYSSGGDSRLPVAGDIRRVEYYVSNQEGMEGTLVRRVTTNLLPGDGVEDGPEEALCRNVTAFSIMYFDGTVWVNTWDSTTHLDATGLGTLPLAVAMHIEISEPDQKVQKVAVTVTLPCAQPLETGAL